MQTHFSVTVLLIAVCLLNGNAQKPCLPVLIIHGIIEPADRLEPLAKTVREAPDCPNGRNVTIIHRGEIVFSIVPMWRQVEVYQQAMMPYFNSNPGGLHIIGYSLGTMVSRAVLEITDNHTAHTLISIAGIQFGIARIPVAQWYILEYFGLTRVIGRFSAAVLSFVCYSKFKQSFLSICDFWRDENYYDYYKKYNQFLPFVNNEIAHNDSERYKTNLLRCRKYVLIATCDDGFVYPWQSGIFGSLNVNRTITDMKNQEIYKDDFLGLKTLNDSGRMLQFPISGVEHVYIPIDPKVINEYIIPYLY